MLFALVEFLDKLVYVSLPVFAISTFYLLVTVKKKDRNFVSDYQNDSTIPDIDLSFFSRLQSAHYSYYKQKTPVVINKISFYLTVIGFIVFFLLAILENVTY